MRFRDLTSIVPSERSYVLPKKAAQNKYVPFTKNRREIVTIQKNDRLGFISFKRLLVYNHIMMGILNSHWAIPLVTLKKHPWF
jgi:hypothetical protein